MRLASLRDLPAQLLELYQQGFSLAALHPFVQPTHEQEKTPLEHIFRAILIKKTERSQKTDHSEDYILELDCCSSLVHQTDKKIIPEFIEKVSPAVRIQLNRVTEYSPERTGKGLAWGWLATLHGRGQSQRLL